MFHRHSLSPLVSFTLQTLRCNLEFEHPITVEQLVVRGSVAGSSGQGLLVGGVNVSRLDAEAVRNQGGTVVIAGHKIFANGFTSHNLIVDGERKE